MYMAERIVMIFCNSITELIRNFVSTGTNIGNLFHDPHTNFFKNILCANKQNIFSDQKLINENRIKSSHWDHRTI